MFREVPKDRLLQVYVSESFYKEEKHQKLLEGCPWELVSDSVFQAVSDTKTPQGVICMVKQFHYSLEDLISPAKGEAPLCMALENLQDPGNLGTILRTAEGAGVSGVLLSRGERRPV